MDSDTDSFIGEEIETVKKNEYGGSYRGRQSEEEFYDRPYIRFNPPVYLQRYHEVRAILKKFRGRVKKIIDLGCGSLGLIPYLKHLDSIEEIMCVDTDYLALRRNSLTARPITIDFIDMRHFPLQITLLQGNVAQRDACLVGADAVICLELRKQYDEGVASDIYLNFRVYRTRNTTPSVDDSVYYGFCRL